MSHGDGAITTDHLAAGGEGATAALPNWPLPGSAPVALLVVPTADPEALWAWPLGVGAVGSGPLPGHHQPRQGQKGVQEEQLAARGTVSVQVREERC